MAFGRALAVQHCKNQLKRTSSRRDGDFDPASAHQAQPGQTQCVQFAMPFRTHDSHFLRDGGMMWPVYVEVFTCPGPGDPASPANSLARNDAFVIVFFMIPSTRRARATTHLCSPLAASSVVLSRRSRLVARPARAQTLVASRVTGGNLARAGAV